MRLIRLRCVKIIAIISIAFLCFLVWGGFINAEPLFDLFMRSGWWLNFYILLAPILLMRLSGQFSSFFNGTYLNRPILCKNNSTLICAALACISLLLFIVAVGYTIHFYKALIVYMSEPGYGKLYEWFDYSNADSWEYNAHGQRLVGDLTESYYEKENAYYDAFNGYLILCYWALWFVGIAIVVTACLWRFINKFFSALLFLYSGILTNIFYCSYNGYGGFLWKFREMKYLFEGGKPASAFVGALEPREYLIFICPAICILLWIYFLSFLEKKR